MPLLKDIWAPTNAQVEEVRKTQKSMKRSMLNAKKTDRTKNNSIKALTQNQSFRKSKFKYAGHSMRASNDRLSKIVIEWRSYEHKRRRGRPKIRWRDN